MSTTRKLVWETFPATGILTAKIEWTIPRRPKEVRTQVFAFVRRFARQQMPWAKGEYLVTRNHFDEVRYFDTKQEAILYVESLFALESH